MSRLRLLLGTGLVLAVLTVVAVNKVTPHVQLAQAAEDTTDACGPRPAKPVPTTTSTATSSTSTSTSSTSTSTSSTSTSTSTSTTLAPERWSCSWVEDFDETELDRARWDVQTTTKGDFGVGGECFVDSPNNIAVSGGTLKLTVREEATTVPCPRASNPSFATPVTAGSIVSRPALDQTYGRYEIRARMPMTTVPGLHFAFWLWPRDLTNYPPSFGNGDSDKWTNGELDVLEWYTRYPYHQVPYIHYAHTYVQTSTGKWVPDDPNITTACLVGNMGDWHTFALEWTPTTIRILYDGHTCLEDDHWHPRNTTMPGPFDKPFMVSLTQALGAIGTDNQAGATTPLPSTAEVDYLKVWH
jgi:hypothetical protein